MQMQCSISCGGSSPQGWGSAVPGQAELCVILCRAGACEQVGCHVLQVAEQLKIVQHCNL